MKNEKKEQKSVEESFKIFGRKVSPKAFLSLAATEDVEFHFGQSAEDSTLLRLFHKMTEGFYVDIGAFHPRKYSNTYVLHRYYGWNGINVDASKETIEKFEQERPNDINLHTAVGSKQGEAVYWKFNYPTINTISETNVQRQLSKEGTEVVDKEHVQVQTLEAILEQHLPKNKIIDLMNIDVEGVDLQVLKSNNWEKYRPRVILIEDYNVSIEGLESSEIYNYMKEIGYKFTSHTFDTSIYVEREFSIERNTLNEKAKSLFNKSNLNKGSASIYTRAKNLSKVHPEIVNIEEKLRIESENNKNLNSLFEEVKKDKSDLRDNLLVERDRVVQLTNIENKLIDQINDLQKQLKAEYQQTKELMVQHSHNQRKAVELQEKLNRNILLVDQLNSDLEHVRNELVKLTEDKLNQGVELVKINEKLKQEHKKNQEHLEVRTALTKELTCAYEELSSALSYQYRSVENKKDEFQNSVKEYESSKKRSRELEVKIKRRKAELKGFTEKLNKSNKERNRYKKLYLTIRNSRSWRYTSFIRNVADRLKGIEKK